MIYICSFVLFYIAFCINLTLTSKFFIHIYQYCEYNSTSYKNWMKENLNVILPRILISLIPPVLINVNHEVGIILAGIIYIISAYLYRKPDYVKHLTINGKVKNIGYILGVLYIAVIGVSLFFFDKIVALSLILAISYVCIPILILLSSKIIKLHKHI